MLLEGWTLLSWMPVVLPLVMFLAGRTFCIRLAVPWVEHFALGFSLEVDRLGVRLDPTFLHDIELMAWG